jgi:hypothetical protein
MLKRPLKCYEYCEAEWPGFVALIAQYENAILPLCPYCGSWHTAQVTAGFVQASMTLFTATTKIMFDFQNRGRVFCNECKNFFTPEDYEGPILWHELIAIDEEPG